MEFQQEKEAREKAAEKQRVESDKQVTLSKILRLSIISPTLSLLSTSFVGFGLVNETKAELWRRIYIYISSQIS